jgi:hypothetical protein
MGNVPGSTVDVSNEKEFGSGGSSKRRSKKSDGDDTDTDDDNNNTTRNNDKHNNNESNNGASRAQKTLGFNFSDWQMGLASGVRKLEEQDHPAAALIDSVCGPYLDRNNMRSTNSHDDIVSGKSSSRRSGREVRSFYSDDVESEDDSRTLSEDETTTATDYNKRNKKSSSNRRRDERRSGRNGNKNSDKDEETAESASCMSQSDYESTVDDFSRRKGKVGSRKKGGNRVRSVDRTHESSYETEDDDDETEAVSTVVNEKSNNGGGRNNNNNINDTSNVFSSGSDPSTMLTKQPLASSFAKRCYFTKQGIGGTSQHYEGLTLTGNVVLMLAAAMKLKGCPTICDEDLRRVEQTYPNQFSRLPDELLLSSGWRRISKYCHFSFKPIPDGVPFFRKCYCIFSLTGWLYRTSVLTFFLCPSYHISCQIQNKDCILMAATTFC